MKSRARNRPTTNAQVAAITLTGEMSSVPTSGPQAKPAPIVISEAGIMKTAAAM